MKSKEQPWSSRETFLPQDPLLGVSTQATTSLPKHPKSRRPGSSRTWRSTPLISHALRGTEHVGLLRNTEGDAQTPPALYPHTTGLAWTLHQPTSLSWPVCPNHCTPSSSSQGEPAGFSFHFHPHPSWPEDNPHPRTGSKTGSAGCQGVLLDQRKG